MPILGHRDGLLAVPVPPLGRVGDPLPCRPPAILTAFADGKVPVVAPLAVGPLNVNADDALAALALGLGASRLVFLTDVAGLYVDDVVLEAIDVARATRMLDEGAFDGGIVPKLRAAALAAASGITAHIGSTGGLASNWVMRRTAVCPMCAVMPLAAASAAARSFGTMPPSNAPSSSMRVARATSMASSTTSST